MYTQSCLLFATTRPIPESMCMMFNVLELRIRRRGQGSNLHSGFPCYCQSSAKTCEDDANSF